jgi:mannose-6-phosphate isomerase-like protein (cupin superfamily)
MRYLKPLILFSLSALAVLPALTVRGQQRGETLAWAPKPTKANSWVAPNKPHWKLSELLTSHKGQASWKETIVSDDLLHADYIQMAPGTKTPRKFHPDNRAWWIVQEGQVRFSIDGQQPILASKGFLIQVPYRNIYNIEVVGDKPALFLEVTAANAQTMYPIDETPTPVAGMEFVKVRVSGKGSYDEINKPFFDFNTMVAGQRGQPRFVVDDRLFANIIRGMPQADNPKDKGHFHEVSAEFWFVLEGTIEYKIEGLETFNATQGDVVYVPKQNWHRAHHGGTGYSTRLAMNGYPDMLHNYQPTEEMR